MDALRRAARMVRESAHSSVVFVGFCARNDGSPTPTHTSPSTNLGAKLYEREQRRLKAEDRNRMSVTFYVVKNGQIIENLVERECGPENELELNVSNSNARMLLDLLGVKVGDEGLTGEIAELAKFEATCMDNLQILRAAPFLDAGRRDRVYRCANSATVIDLALRDGYLTDRVAKLRELAQFALLNGGKLVFA